MSRYRASADGVLRRGSRDVVAWCDEIHSGAHFRCPCDQRVLNVRQPPHGIEFSAEGLLTLTGSCGSRADVARGILKGKPANWCHFWIKNGVPEVASDAQCPGKDL